MLHSEVTTVEKSWLNEDEGRLYCDNIVLQHVYEPVSHVRWGAKKTKECEPNERSRTHVSCPMQ